MTYFDYMIKKIKAGYWIIEEKYENGGVAYELRNKKRGKSYDTLGIKFSRQFAQKLIKATGVRLEQAKRTTICLNYVPSIPNNNTIFIMQ